MQQHLFVQVCAAVLLCGALLTVSGQRDRREWWHTTEAAALTDPEQAGLRTAARQVAPFAAAISTRLASTVPLSKFEPDESLNERYAAMEKRLAVSW